MQNQTPTARILNVANHEIQAVTKAARKPPEIPVMMLPMRDVRTVLRKRAFGDKVSQPPEYDGDESKPELKGSLLKPLSVGNDIGAESSVGGVVDGCVGGRVEVGGLPMTKRRARVETVSDCALGFEFTAARHTPAQAGSAGGRRHARPPLKQGLCRRTWGLLLTGPTQPLRHRRMSSPSAWQVLNAPTIVLFHSSFEVLIKELHQPTQLWSASG